jgi:hypothetical protein
MDGVEFPERDCAESQSQQVGVTNVLRLVCDTAALHLFRVQSVFHP